jgi:hypothetical protein
MERLEQVAPSLTPQQSEFVCAAIRRALDELAELRTAEAYRRLPDDPYDVYLDPDVWEAPESPPSPEP